MLPAHSARSCYLLKWPIHALMSVRLLTADDLHRILEQAGEKALMQRDHVRPFPRSLREITLVASQEKRKPFYYLARAPPIEESSRIARDDDAPDADTESPLEQGPHDVSVTHNGRHVLGSPVMLRVAPPRLLVHCSLTRHGHQHVWSGILVKLVSVTMG